MSEHETQAQAWVRKFLFRTPLYVCDELSSANATSLFVDQLEIEEYCPYCKEASIFRRYRGSRSNSAIESLTEFREPYLFEMTCKRNLRHNIIFFFHMEDRQIQKIGQHPSPQSLHHSTSSWPPIWPRVANLVRQVEAAWHDSPVGKWFLGIAVVASLLTVFGATVYAISHKPPQKNNVQQLVEDQALNRQEDKLKSISALQSQELKQSLNQFATLARDLETLKSAVSKNSELISSVTARLDQRESDEARLMDLLKTVDQKDDPAQAEKAIEDDHSADAADSKNTAAKPHDAENSASADKATNADKPAGADKSTSAEVPHLGIQVSADAARNSPPDGRGIVIAGVDPGSPAERAGVQQSDLLLKVGDTDVNNPAQMADAIRTLKGKHAVVLTLKRGTGTQRVRLKLS